jgi:hypothetical protein
MHVQDFGREINIIKSVHEYRYQSGSFFLTIVGSDILLPAFSVLFF